MVQPLKQTMPNLESTYNRSRFLKTWAIMFGAVGFPAAYFTGFSLYLLYVAFGTLVLSVLVYVFVSWAGNSIGNIFFGFCGKASIREQLAGELDKARHHLRHQDYEAARQLIDAVLKIEPKYGDALLVKAQIEISAGNKKQAKAVLRELRSVSELGDRNHRWATTLLNELMDAN